MENEVKEIAGVLRSTEAMAEKFAQRVQERVGQPVSYEGILDVMQHMSPTTLTMDKLVTRLKRELDK